LPVKAHETSAALVARGGGNHHHRWIKGSDNRVEILAIRTAHNHASHCSGQVGVARSAIVLM